MSTLGQLAVWTALLLAPVRSIAEKIDWRLPDARDVQLGDSLGEAYGQGIQRLSLPPYDRPIYLRSDFSFETNRIFVNYSGDEIASCFVTGKSRRINLYEYRRTIFTHTASLRQKVTKWPS